MNDPIPRSTSSSDRSRLQVWGKADRWQVCGRAIIAVAICVATLRLLGRTWWCACETPHLFITGIWSAHNSQHLFDPYTFSHIQHGLLLYGLLAVVAPKLSLAARGIVAVVIECGWEVFENTRWVIEKYRESTVSVDYLGDSIVNSVADVGACALGYSIAATVPVVASVVGLVVIEVAMVLMIRDSLVLNLLMLVYPFEAIKQWQGL